MVTETPNIPKYYINVLGYHANIAESQTTFDPNRSQHLGIGGEAKVRMYDVHENNEQNSKRVIKVFHPPFERYDEKSHQIIRLNEREIPPSDISIELSKNAYIVATNARLCGRIQNIEEIKRVVNKGEDKLRSLGINGYHIRNLQESFGSSENLNIQGFLDFLRQRAMETGNYHELQRIPQTLPSPNGYKGGMIAAINKLAEWAAFSYPNLQLPDKIFPDFYQFGILDDNYPSDYANRFYVAMEYIPNSLMNIIEKGLKEIGHRTNSIDADSSQPQAVFSALMSIIQSQVPLKKIQNVQTMLRIIHSLGFVFGDLKRGNIGIRENGNPILLDPSSMIRTGSIQDFATLEFLPPDQQMLLKSGQLRGLPSNDIYAFQVITTSLGASLQRALQNGLSISNIEREEREDHESSTIRAKLGRTS